jgi:hypothetical protein
MQFAERTQSFGPSKSLNGLVDDVFANYVDAVLEVDNSTRRSAYLNDWNLYHRQCGETHCGTNSKRAIATTPWWQW